MTSDELRLLLSREFDVVAFVDLADAWHKHSSIFDTFKSVYRSEFADNQRVVLYSASDLSQSFLDHIQRAAAKVDISNFFILIVCPCDLSEKLIQANRKFGHDDVTMRSLLLLVEDTKPLGSPGFYKMDNVCPLPFLHVSITTNGEVSPCCKFRDATGSLANESLSEVFYNEKTQSIRTQMLAGEKPAECSICWDNEAAGTTSFRHLALQKYEDQMDHGWIDDPQLRAINWSPRSLCNFSCRICHPISSTRIAVEQMEFSTDRAEKARLKLLIKETNNDALNDKVIRSLPELKHLEKFHLLGGEPLISPDFFAAVDELIENKLAPAIDLEFNTNCSIFPEEYLQKIINNFRSLEILMSVDNVGEKFEIERGGRWEDILQNIKRFVALRSERVDLKFEIAVNLQNVLDLDALVSLAETLDIGIVWWYVENPQFMCIDRATQKTKELAAERYRNHRNTELQNIANRMMTSVGSDGSEFIEYCLKIDARRNQTFSQSHPEIFRAMGGSV